MEQILLTAFTASELEAIIKKCVQQVLNENGGQNQRQGDETGGIELAIRITGYARPTIYSLVSQRIIPHAKRGKKLWFSKGELIAWINSGKRKTVDDLKKDVDLYFRK